MELTVKQWKALALAYPLYGKVGSHQGEKGEGETHSGELPPGFAEFVNAAVPRLQTVFNAHLPSASAKGHAGGVDARRIEGSASRKPLWRNAIPAALDQLLAHFFRLEDTTPTMYSNTEAGALRPLTFAEVQLLYLYHRERTKVETLQAALDELKTSAERDQRTAAGAAAAAATAATAAAEAAVAAVMRERHDHARYAKSDREDSLGREMARGHQPDGGHGHSSVSQLGGAGSGSLSPPGATGRRTALPVASPSRPAASETAAAVERATGLSPPSPTTVLVSALASVPMAVTTPQQQQQSTLRDAIEVVCEECHEVGGELFRCRRCGSIRHEACGGPHPTSTIASSGLRSGDEAVADNPTGLCRVCRKEVNIFSSSSSSMHSSTSSEERREIDAYFGVSDDDADSADSFLVHTSEERDGSSERSDAESASEHASSSSSSSTSSVTREGRKEVKGEEEVQRRSSKMQRKGKDRQTGERSSKRELTPSLARAVAVGPKRSLKRRRTREVEALPSLATGSDDEELALLGLNTTDARTGTTAPSSTARSLKQSAHGSPMRHGSASPTRSHHAERRRKHRAPRDAASSSSSSSSCPSSDAE